MVLADATWQEVESFSREAVVLIPTGSLEQHGPHLPLFTDTLLVTAVARRVEQEMPDKILLTPPLWLGASAHHLKFAGSLSAELEGYVRAIGGVVRPLLSHRFYRFYVINGHGGNTSFNDVALRALKSEFPNATFGHRAYYSFAENATAETLEGPIKVMRHADEAEASLMLHLHPELVRKDRLRDDGLVSDPSIAGLVSSFDEITEEGSFGHATLATAEKGNMIFEAAVNGLTRELGAIADGYVLRGVPTRQGSPSVSGDIE